MAGSWRYSLAVIGMTGLLALVGCGGGGGDRSPVVLEGDEAVQGALAVVQSTVSILIGMRTEDESPLLTGGCSSGVVDGACEVENRMTIARGHFRQCRIDFLGRSVTANGRLRLETDDVAVCAVGRIRGTATVVLDYDNLEQTLRDVSGNEVAHSVVDGTDLLVPDGVGCAGRNFIETVDATSDSSVNFRVPGKLATDGLDARVRTRGLRMEQSSSGTPCLRAAIVNGEMEVDDRANAIRYAQTLEEVHLSFREENNEAVVELEGALVNDCIGTIAVSTVEPLRLRNATDCPRAGVLHITASGRTSEMRFGGPGQFTVDYDMDGQTEIVGSDCRGIAQCTR